MHRNLWVLAAAFALLVTMTASAQNTNLKANVPFNFIVGGSTLPAGEYSFESLNNAQGALAIRGVNSGKGVLTQSGVIDKKPSDPSPRAKLVFHHYGDQYFLAELWIAGNDTGRRLPESRREKEMAMNSSVREVVLSSPGH